MFAFQCVNCEPQMLVERILELTGDVKHHHCHHHCCSNKLTIIKITFFVIIVIIVIHRLWVLHHLPMVRLHLHLSTEEPLQQVITTITITIIIIIMVII